MGKTKPLLMWTIEEESQLWPDEQPTASTANSTHPLPEQAATSAGERRLVFLLLLISVILAGGWMWLKVPAADKPAAGEVTILAHGDFQALEPERLRWLAPHVAEAANTVLPTHLAAELVDLIAVIQANLQNEKRVVQTSLLNFQDNVALVEVVTSDKGGEQRYRRTLAYRHTDAGWHRTTSGGDIWGSWQTWEAGHLSIRYRSGDAATVAEAAPIVAQYYNNLRSDVGLPLIEAAPSITIELVTEGAPEEYHFDFATRTIGVPSPAVLTLPVEMASATVFYDSLLFPIADMVLAEMKDRQTSHSQLVLSAWQPVMNALRLWAVWKAPGSSASERAEIISWLHQNTEAKQVEARQGLPPGYERLCGTFRLWELSPSSLKTRLDCKARLSPWREPSMPAKLVGQYYGQDSRSEGDIINAVALETVIEYVVASYGRHTIPRLIAAMAEHTTYQSLIPAVFDIPVSDFEAGWQAYLAKQYP